MKKYIITAIVAFLYLLFPLFAPPTIQTDASGETYACILEDDTYFYTAKNEKQGLFLLPKTYFVKVLDSAPDYCKVEYLYDGSDVKKLVGYAKTSQLTFVNFVPKTPYLHLLFEVCYRIEESKLSGNDSLNEIKITCAYYGDFYVGSKAYCYVLRGDDFGYVLKPDDLSYEENPEYALHYTPPESLPTDEKSTSSNTSPAQIAILIALCLLVPLLAWLIIKPPRRLPYEEED